MKIFLYGTISILLAWLIHLVMWRIALPKKHTKSLIIIFLSVLSLTCMFGSISQTFYLNGIQILHLIIFYIPIMLAYACFYSAVEEDSPSLGLIALTAKKQICKFEDYYEIVNYHILVDSRLPAMIRDGLLIQISEQYQLTPKGWRIAKLFKMAHSFFKFSEAG